MKPRFKFIPDDEMVCPVCEFFRTHYQGMSLMLTPQGEEWLCQRHKQMLQEARGETQDPR